MRGGYLVSLHRPYRVCPDCKTKYTTDPGTKKRGLVVAVLSVLTIILSAAGFLVGFPWGFLTFFFGTGTLIYAGHAVKKTAYIRYDG
jgi:hypothetical protein